MNFNRFLAIVWVACGVVEIFFGSPVPGLVDFCIATVLITGQDIIDAIKETKR